MTILHVNKSVCIRCGVCAEECVSGTIAMGEAGPRQANEHCIACGHCVAVCPTAALDNDKCPLRKQAPLPAGQVALSPDAAEIFLRSRHSERCFKPDPVPRDAIKKLLDIARFAPTGGNTQGIRYLVIDERAVLDRLTKAIFAWGRDESAKGSRLGQLMARFEERHHREGRDTIFWDAPCLIIAAPTPGRFCPSPRDSAVLSLLYALLYAPSLGLGTCWSGLVEAAAAARHPAFLEAMREHAGIEVAGAVMVGYPKHVYHRLVDRETAAVEWW